MPKENLMDAYARYCASEKNRDRENVIQRFLLGTQILQSIKELATKENETWISTQTTIKADLKAIAQYTISVFYDAYHHAKRPLEADCSKDEFFEMIICTPESADIFCQIPTPSDLHLFFMLHMSLKNGDHDSLKRYKELLHVTDIQFAALYRHYDNWMNQVTNLFNYYELSFDKRKLLEMTLTRLKTNTVLHIENQQRDETLAHNATLLDTILLEKLLFFLLIMLVSHLLHTTVSLQPLIPLMGLFQLMSYHSVNISDHSSNHRIPAQLSLACFKNLILHGHNGNANAALDYLQSTIDDYETSATTLPKMKSFIATLTMLFFIGCMYQRKNVLTSISGLLWFSALSLLQHACLIVINSYEKKHPMENRLFKPPITEDLGLRLRSTPSRNACISKK